MFKSKDEIQDYFVELSSTYKNFCGELATGLGKSYAAIRIIEKNGGKWNIVIAETNHETNWINEFKLHGKEHLLKDVTFLCYQSLHKYVEDAHYVFDEVHHLSSDKRLNLLTEIVKIQKDKFNILLSATLSRTQKELLTFILPNLKIFKISISQAIDWGLLPKPSVYLIPIILDDTIKDYEFNFSRDKKVKCTQVKYYEFITDRFEYLKTKYFSSRNEFDKVKWLRAGGIRKQFLSNCKTKYVKQLLDKLSTKRTICFAGSIPQAKELDNSVCIHSKLSKKVREKLIEDFNSKRINRLVAVGMLKEGMNLTDIEVGIITQLDNVERYFSQIHGRVLRSQYPEQYVFFVENTQDEKYISTAFENFNKEYIATINIEDI